MIKIQVSYKCQIAKKKKIVFQDQGNLFTWSRSKSSLEDRNSWASAPVVMHLTSTGCDLVELKSKRDDRWSFPSLKHGEAFTRNVINLHQCFLKNKPRSIPTVTVFVSVLQYQRVLKMGGNLSQRSGRWFWSVLDTLSPSWPPDYSFIPMSHLKRAKCLWTLAR